MKHNNRSELSQRSEISLDTGINIKVCAGANQNF